MSDETTHYNDEEFERLVRAYDRQKTRGVNGLISRIATFREGHRYLEPEQFDRFCERNYIRSNIEKDLLHHFGKRLEILGSILGSQLGSFCVLQVLLQSRNEFEKLFVLASRCSDPDTRSLFRDLVEGLLSRVNKMKPGDPDVDIWGMNWKSDLMPREPILKAHDSET